jgi:hypothetical protein
MRDPKLQYLPIWCSLDYKTQKECQTYAPIRQLSDMAEVSRANGTGTNRAAAEALSEQACEHQGCATESTTRNQAY